MRLRPLLIHLNGKTAKCHCFSSLHSLPFLVFHQHLSLTISLPSSLYVCLCLHRHLVLCLPHTQSLLVGSPAEPSRPNPSPLFHQRRSESQRNTRLDQSRFSWKRINNLRSLYSLIRVCFT